MPEDKLRKLYDNVSESYDLPDFETFRVDMTNENKRKRFYENISQEYDMPDYGQFVSDMGFGEPQKKKGIQPSPPQQNMQQLFQGRFGAGSPPSPSTSELGGSTLTSGTPKTPATKKIDLFKGVGGQMSSDATTVADFSKTPELIQEDIEKADPKYWAKRTEKEAIDRGYENAEQLFEDRLPYLTNYLGELDKQEYDALEEWRSLKQRNAPESDAAFSKYLDIRAEQRGEFANIQREIDETKKTLERMKKDGLLADGVYEKENAVLAKRQKLIDDAFKPVYDPQKSMVDFIEENKSEIAQLTKGKNAKQMLAEYVNALYTQKLDMEEKLGLEPNDGGFSRYFDEWFIRQKDNFGGKKTGEQYNLDKLYELDLKLRTAVKLYALNRTGYKPDTPETIFAKGFAKSLVPSVTSKTPTSQQIAQNINSVIEEAGISNAVIKERGKEIEETAQPYTPYSAEWWAEATAPTAAIMLEFIPASMISTGALKSFDLGRKLIRVAETGKAGDLGSVYLNNLAKTKVGRGLVQSLAKGGEYGVQSATLATLFPENESEMNLISGMLAGTGGSLASKTTKALFNPMIGSITRTFGAKSPQAVIAIQALGSKVKENVSERAIGELVEETIENLVSIYRETENFNEFLATVEEQFGTLDKATQYTVQVLVMGVGMGLGSEIGKALMSKGVSAYDNLDDSEKVKVDAIMNEVNNEEKEIQNKTINEQEKDDGTTTDTSGIKTDEQGTVDGTIETPPSVGVVSETGVEGEGVQAEEVTTPTVSPPALRDVESTAKALEDIYNSELSEPNKIIKAAEVVVPIIEALPNERKLELAELTGDRSNSIRKNKIAIEYAKAKLKPENTRTNQEQELVQAVESLLSKEQTTTDIGSEVAPDVSNPALKDVESTAKALEGALREGGKVDEDGFQYRNEKKVMPIVDTFTDKMDEDYQRDVFENEIKTPEQFLSEAYHKAKADSSNPQLVEAVESLLGTTQPTPPTEVGGDTPTGINESVEGEVIPEGGQEIAPPTVSQETVEVTQPTPQTGEGATPTVTPEVGVGAKTIADKIRGLKVDTKGKAFDASIGIPAAVYNAAVEIVATSVEGGVKLGNAIAKAMKYIDEQMKGKSWNKGLFAKDMNVRYSVTLPNGNQVEVERDTSKEAAQVINGWYQPIEQKILDAKQDKMPANKWAELLRSKEDEDAWTGVRRFLEEKGDASVTKQELKDFIKENRVEIVEVVKGEALDKKQLDPRKNSEGDWDIYYKGEKIFVLDDYQAKDREEAIEVVLDADIDWKGGTTKFSQYQLEGEKENYKEVLVTLPSSDIDKRKRIKDLEDKIEDARKRQKEEKDFLKRGDIYKNEIQPLELQLNEAKGQDRVGTIKFQSTHFDEPNILVHLRMNTRTDAEGNKVLFLEEIQSDWGQKGKKVGFVGENIFKANQKENGSWDVFKKGVFVKNVFADNELSAIKIAGYNPEFKGFPTAPFVTSTPSWVKLGIKTAIKEAVNQGATKIAWTTGEQQNERYDLSKQVEYIQYEDGFGDNRYVDISHKSGVTTLYVDKNTGKVTEEKNTPLNAVGQKLEDVIGKELAEKVLQDKKSGRIEGEGLKVGGSGMKGFYDNIVPSVAKAVVKELTGQEGVVGEVEIEVEAKYTISDTYVAESDRAYNLYTKVGDKMLSSMTKETGGGFSSESLHNELLYLANKYADKNKQSSTQQSIEITPELKASIESGVPLFSASKAIEAINKLKIDTKGKLNAFGLIPAVWNATLDIVAKAIEGGATLAEAIEKGMKYARRWAANNRAKFDEKAAVKFIENAVNEQPQTSATMTDEQKEKNNKAAQSKGWDNAPQAINSINKRAKTQYKTWGEIPKHVINYISGIRNAELQGTDKATALKAAYKYLEMEVKDGNITKEQADELANTVSASYTPKTKSPQGTLGEGVEATTQVGLANLKKEFISKFNALKEKFKSLEKGRKQGIMSTKALIAELQNLAKEYDKATGVDKATKSPRTERTLRNRRGGIRTFKDLDAYKRYVDKVVKDGNYADKVTKAKGIAKKIQKLTDSKKLTASDRSYIANLEFLKPNMVSNIDEYIQLLEKFEQSLRGAKLAENARKTELDAFINREKEYITKLEEKLQKEEEENQKLDDIAEAQDAIEQGLYSGTVGDYLEDLELSRQEDIDAKSAEAAAMEEAREKINAAREGKNVESEISVKSLAKVLMANKDFMDALAENFTPTQVENFIKWVNTPTSKEQYRVLSLDDSTLLSNALQNAYENGDFSGMGSIIAKTEATVKVGDLAKSNPKFKNIDPNEIKNMTTRNVTTNIVFDLPTMEKMDEILKRNWGRLLAKMTTRHAILFDKAKSVIKKYKLDTKEQQTKLHTYAFINQWFSRYNTEEKNQHIKSRAKKLVDNAAYVYNEVMKNALDKGMMPYDAMNAQDTLIALQELGIISDLDLQVDNGKGGYEAKYKLNEDFNPDEMESKMTSNELAAYREILDIFSQMRPSVKRNTMLYTNQQWDDIENYFPTISRQTVEDIAIQSNGSLAFISQQIGLPKTQGRSKQRVENPSNISSEKRIYELGFNNVLSQGIWQNILISDSQYEINYLVDLFSAQSPLRKLLGGSVGGLFSDVRNVYVSRLQEDLANGFIPKVEPTATQEAERFMFNSAVNWILKSYKQIKQLSAIPAIIARDPAGGMKTMALYMFYKANPYGKAIVANTDAFMRNPIALNDIHLAQFPIDWVQDKKGFKKAVRKGTELQEKYADPIAFAVGKVRGKSGQMQDAAMLNLFDRKNNEFISLYAFVQQYMRDGVTDLRDIKADLNRQFISGDFDKGKLQWADRFIELLNSASHPSEKPNDIKQAPIKYFLQSFSYITSNAAKGYKELAKRATSKEDAAQFSRMASMYWIQAAMYRLITFMLTNTVMGYVADKIISMFDDDEEKLIKDQDLREDVKKMKAKAKMATSLGGGFLGFIADIKIARRPVYAMAALSIAANAMYRAFMYYYTEQKKLKDPDFIDYYPKDIMQGVDGMAGIGIYLGNLVDAGETLMRNSKTLYNGKMDMLPELGLSITPLLSTATGSGYAREISTSMSKEQRERLQKAQMLIDVGLTGEQIKEAMEYLKNTPVELVKNNVLSIDAGDQLRYVYVVDSDEFYTKKVNLDNIKGSEYNNQPLAVSIKKLARKIAVIRPDLSDKNAMRDYKSQIKEYEDFLSQVFASGVVKHKVFEVKTQFLGEDISIEEMGDRVSELVKTNISKNKKSEE
jgi:hypothetical protein